MSIWSKSNLGRIRKICVVMVIVLTYQIIFPVTTYALTSGPGQSEFGSFEPVGTSRMVDKFTGDFTYNIPLLEVPGPNGGYPLNLAYHSGAGMDTEASWVGLGWSLNAGALQRQMRGIPDDFNGDEIKVTKDIMQNWTAGVKIEGSFEINQLNVLEGINLGMDLYYNRYRGVGYGINTGLSIGNKRTVEDKTLSGIGGALDLDFSFDSQEGFGFSPSLNITKKIETEEEKTFISNSGGVGITINSRDGLSNLQLETSSSKTKEESNSNNKVTDREKLGGGSHSLALGFNRAALTPSLDLEWGGLGIDRGIKLGPKFTVLFPSAHISGFYNTQYLKNKVTNTNALGYLHLDKYDPEDRTVLMDFNRDGAGAVGKETPNLAIPNATFDIYTTTGQGIGGAFRPYRDIGVFHSNKKVSTSGGLGLGYDFGVGDPWHMGLSGNGNYSHTYSGAWDDGGDDFSDVYNFDKSSVSNDYEEVYFKNQGEHTTENEVTIQNLLGQQWEDPLRIKLDKQKATTQLENKDGSIDNISATRTDRKPKQMSTLHLTNEEVGDMEDEFPYLRADYFGSGTSDDQILLGNGKEDLDRGNQSIRKSHHTGAFLATNPSGMRYSYAIPAYNVSHEERIFSVKATNANQNCAHKLDDISVKDGEVDYKKNGTSKFLSKTETPPYAHSYLLTSIMGTDYVDRGAKGFDDDDLGYWVKFDYEKVYDDYNWRSPYRGASYMQGTKLDLTDDKAAFLNGTKEIWYLRRIETATHVGIFKTENTRTDSKEAVGAFAGGNDVGSRGLHKLKYIELYNKKDLEVYGTSAKPLQVIELNHEQTLCDNIQNGTEGKLTLKEIYFKSENSTRGLLNPYRFHYAAEVENPVLNPSYSENRYDRWGKYKPLSGTDECDNLEFPYVEQFTEDDFTSNPETKAQLFKDEMDEGIKAWQLTSVELPSGATMKIDYERDDYAYVQDRVATQMFRIKSLRPYDEFVSGSNGHRQLYNGNDDQFNNGEDRRLYFELEKPLAENSSASILAVEMEKYIDDLHMNEETGNKQLYYKILSKIKSDSSDDDALYDYVSGYLDLVDGNPVGIDYTSNVNGYYRWGYVELEESDNDKYHPLEVATYQHIRASLSHIAMIPYNVDDEEPLGNKTAIKQKIGSLVSPFTEFLSMMKGYYKYCRSRDKGKLLNLESGRSVIRLNTPDKIKFGGGLRVKQISMEDNWDNDASTYGQVYDYTMEEDGMRISSGVAANEPTIGGDESALRYAKSYTKKLKLKTDENLFFEYPINDAYYPAPHIGYRQVTVKSLATHLAGLSDSERQEQYGSDYSNLPDDFQTTGKEVHEYYTAKDFPVITDETKITNYRGSPWIGNDNDHYSLWFALVPTVGNMLKVRSARSQGYSVITNDMHGKPMKVSYYAQDQNGNYEENPMAYTEYRYRHKTKVHKGRTVKVLDNRVKVIEDYHNHNLVDGKYELPTDYAQMGVDYEIFADMAEADSEVYSAGVAVGNDQILFFPSIGVSILANHNESRLRTAVLNKAIHKSGILESVEAFDSGATSIARNEVYDPLTGQAVLTSVNTVYDQQKIHNFTYPAYTTYEGMGPAYENAGLRFDADIQTIGLELAIINPSETSTLGKLVEGDEFLVSHPSLSKSVKCYYLGTGEIQGNPDDHLIYMDTPIPQTVLEDANFFIVRSGKRNQLGAAVGAITALENPIENRDVGGVCDYNPCKGVIASNPESFYSMDGILGTSATVFREGWDCDDSYNEQLGQFEWINEYGNGRKGIWKPYENFVYVADRNQTGVSTDDMLDLSDDGDMDDVAVFDWKNPFYANCDEHTGWKSTGIVTKYETGNPVESRNRLGQNTSSLSGYDNYLNTCVAVNARYHEIAYENFEERMPINGDNSKMSHISLMPGTTSDRPKETYDIQCGSIAEILIEAPIEEVESNVVYFSVSQDYVEDVSGQPILKNQMAYVSDPSTISGFESVSDDITKITLSAPITALKQLDSWSGRITLYYGTQSGAVSSSVNDFATSLELTDEKAHTGMHSLKVNQEYTINQNQLNLIPGKEYMISAWITSDANSLLSPEKLDELADQGNSGISVLVDNIDVTFHGTGEAVEGWRRMEGRFVIPENYNSIALKFNPGPFGVPIYIDDLRIHPTNAAMQTYVYDPHSYRLLATLDDNNFATYYKYGPGGGVYLVKQETEKGIVTIQQSQGYIKPKTQ